MRSLYTEIWQQGTACELISQSWSSTQCKNSEFPYTFRVDAFLVVKIGDFGLARDVYCGNYCRANSAARLPVKWMAPETLHDAISNEKTDVVSRW